MREAKRGRGGRRDRGDGGRGRGEGGRGARGGSGGRRGGKEWDGAGEGRGWVGGGGGGAALLREDMDPARLKSRPGKPMDRPTLP